MLASPRRALLCPPLATQHDAMATKTYTIEECLKHCDDKDCWLIIDGKVYDVTPFLDEHPGGFDTLVSNSGESTWGR